MKRLFLSVSLPALVVVMSLASIRTPEDARYVAYQFMQSEHVRLGKPALIDMPNLVYTRFMEQESIPAFYVFNNTSEGFVIVSAESDTRSILGYADKGDFNPNNIPSNVQFWLDMYSHEITSVLSEEDAEWSETTAGSGNNLRQELPTRALKPAAGVYAAVSPICKSTWNQDAPYNNLCPSISEEKTVTGCVATATAQVMYVHKFPAQGTGSHAYTWKGKTLSANFGNTTYQWSLMKDSYAGNYTTAQADAIAKLMYHVGVGCEMDYGVASTGGSAASNYSACQALVNYFGYDAAIQVLPKSYMPENKILQTMNADLSKGHAILMQGATKNNEGHSFVCDGMDVKGYLHLNWGWGGYCDGYFALSVMDPEGQGIGGAASEEAFTEQVAAFCGIQPDKGGKYYPCLTIDSVQMVSSVRIAKTEAVQFVLQKVYNQGICNAEALYAVVYTDAGEIIGGIDVEDLTTLETGFYFSVPLAYSIGLGSLQEGNYTLQFCPMKDDTVYPAYVFNKGQVLYPFTITSDSIFFADATYEQDTVPDPEPVNEYLPTHLVATAGNGTLLLEWETQAGANWDVVLSWEGNSQSFQTKEKYLGLNVSGFDGVTIAWKVATIDASGNLLSEYVEGEAVTIEKNPYEPINLTATEVGNMTYRFSWGYNSLPSPQYLLHITIPSGETYKDVVTQTMQAEVTFTKEGYYDWSVYAADEEGYLQGYADGESIKVSRKSDAIEETPADENKGVLKVLEDGVVLIKSGKIVYTLSGQ